MMRTTVTIDKAGRIVVPRKLRDDLHLKAGDELEIDASDEAIHLRPRRTKSRLIRENGMWVIDTGGPVLTAEIVRDIIEKGRRERLQRVLGGLVE
ncbi:MAG: AbrB/MazE/SpoVT family DNA-binding domain-containing protein [Acidobacteriaceae bacterium]